MKTREFNKIKKAVDAALVTLNSAPINSAFFKREAATRLRMLADNIDAANDQTERIIASLKNEDGRLTIGEVADKILSGDTPGELMTYLNAFDQHALKAILFTIGRQMQKAKTKPCCSIIDHKTVCPKEPCF